MRAHRYGLECKERRIVSKQPVNDRKQRLEKKILIDKVYAMNELMKNFEAHLGKVYVKFFINRSWYD